MQCVFDFILIADLTERLPILWACHKIKTEFSLSWIMSQHKKDDLLVFGIWYFCNFLKKQLLNNLTSELHHAFAVCVTHESQMLNANANT